MKSAEAPSFFGACRWLLGLGRLILGMACVFCWMLGVWVCVQTDGPRRLAATVVVRVALSSLGSSFLLHCSAHVLRGFVCVDDIPPCAPRPWRWRSREEKKTEKKTKKQKKATKKKATTRYTIKTSSITFFSLTMIRILDMI